MGENRLQKIRVLPCFSSIHSFSQLILISTAHWELVEEAWSSKAVFFFTHLWHTATVFSWNFGPAHGWLFKYPVLFVGASKHHISIS